MGCGTVAERGGVGGRGQEGGVVGELVVMAVGTIRGGFFGATEHSE